MRWPHAWSHGRRPDGWHIFEAPALLRQAGKPRADIATMSGEEIVYLTDADETERAQIEDIWRGDIALASSKNALEPSAHGVPPRVIACEWWGVPGWFFDREAQ